MVIIAKTNTTIITIIAVMKFSRMEPLNIQNTLSIQGYLVYPRLSCSKYMSLVSFIMMITPTIRRLLALILQASLPLVKLCAMVTMQMASQPSVQSFSLPLKLVSEDRKVAFPRQPWICPVTPHHITLLSEYSVQQYSKVEQMYSVTAQLICCSPVMLLCPAGWVRRFAGRYSQVQGSLRGHRRSRRGIDSWKDPRKPVHWCPQGHRTQGTVMDQLL